MSDQSSCYCAVDDDTLVSVVDEATGATDIGDVAGVVDAVASGVCVEADTAGATGAACCTAPCNSAFSCERVMQVSPAESLAHNSSADTWCVVNDCAKPVTVAARLSTFAESSFTASMSGETSPA